MAENETKLTDVYVRAVDADGTIQIGMADPEQPYGDRPVEVVSVSRKQAFTLIGQLATALAEKESWNGKLLTEAMSHCPQCGTALKYDSGRMTCPEGHGSYGQRFVGTAEVTP